MERLTSITQSNDTVVDKRIISKLLVTYFDANARTDRKEVLGLMARILGLGEDEQRKVCTMRAERNVRCRHQM